MIAAVILGGSLAWESSRHTDVQSATVGGADW